MSMKEDVNYTTKATVAHNIAVLRDILGLTQEGFAERVQLPVERIRQMEGGPGALDNCVDLLRIAQSCNVQYVDLFETEAETEGHTKCNAHVPKYVMDVIDTKRIKEGLTKRELCDKAGTHFTSWAKWMGGVCNPSPLSFNNIVAILGLKYYDFDAAKPRSAEPEQKQAQEPVVEEKIGWDLPEPKPELLKSKDSDREEPALTREDIAKAPEEITQPDEFETRMLKVMRLQNRIDQYVADLDDIVKSITILRNELAKLK